MTQAANDVARAELEVRKNRLLPTIEAEKNTLALEEAQAREKEVREARMLRRQTAEAELRRLHIRRERAERAMRHAEQNTQNMVVRAPFDGLIVMQPIFRGSALTEIQEGDEVRAGVPIAQIVDPSAMQVRARVSQADSSVISAGQPARISLDAYPGSNFPGSVKQVAPLAITSSVTPAVRAFVTLVTISESDPTLMPDLSAAADIVVDRRENVLVVPRDAVVVESSGAWVQLERGGSFVRQKVTLDGLSDLQAVIASGVTEGAVVARRAAGIN
jgi:multidrug resistance efflux pump